MSDLRSKLEALSWNDLRRTARDDYGIRILPEYKAADLIRLVLDKDRSNTNYVTDKEQIADKNEKYGWSRIIVRPGRNDRETHCRAAHNGYKFAIPYNVEVNIPTVTAEYLTTKRTPRPVERDNGTEIVYEDRWMIQFVEKHYGPNNERDYVPPEARGKYWNNAREAKLKIKRRFFEEMGYWPTDKALRDHMTAGTFKRETISV